MIAQAVLTGKRLDLNLAKAALRDTIRHTSQAVALRDVELAVCQLFQVSAEALKSDSRTRSLAYPRMMAMYLSRKHTGAAYSEIGRHFGGRNHSTVISGEKKVQTWLRAEEQECGSCLALKPSPTSWPILSEPWEHERSAHGFPWRRPRIFRWRPAVTDGLSRRRDKTWPMGRTAPVSSRRLIGESMRDYNHGSIASGVPRGNCRAEFTTIALLQSNLLGPRMAMAADDPGSVTRWIEGLKAGQVEAASALWDRYYERVVAVARRRLGTAPHQAVEDAEDAALSAIHGLCAGAAQGRFDRLNDRVDLWQLLTAITVKKALGQHQRHGRLKRGGNHATRGYIADEDSEDGRDDVLAQVLSNEPNPETAAMIRDQFQELLDSLSDPTLRQIALWRMDGLSNVEIAREMGCVVRTVERKIERIRLIWEEISDSELD